MSADAATPPRPVRPGKYATPLAMCFQARAYTPRMGLDWLQERGHVSDLCVTLADIAPVADIAPIDAARVVFRAYWAGRTEHSPTEH